jgi:hypothetical protein
MLSASIGLPSEAVVAELPDVEITPPAEAELEVSEPLPLDAEPAELDPLSPLPMSEEAESLPLTAGDFAFAELPLGDSALLDAGGGDGETGTGATSGEGGSALPAANFFGTEARANRIVFVVDNSNSMDEGRFETALTELARSVEALAPTQSFYVIFYSDTAYRLFHPHPEDALVPATPQNKARLRAWLGTAEMCVGGRLVDAFEIAAELRPQVVYLLSDGVIGSYPISYLTQQRDWRFTVHTVGMTVPDREAAENLVAIAEANDGVFRAVGVSPLAQELARRRPVRKNRTRGPVWGVELPPR